MHPLAILAVAVIVVLASILWFRMHAFVALILAALLVAFLTPQTRLEDYAASQVDSKKWSETQADKFVHDESFAVRVAKGFGTMCGSVGILIAMASIIGKCLLDSGAADRIVRSILRLVGEARAGLSFVLSGFVLGVPVFFDTVFYLMIPLGKAAARRVGGNYVFFILTIVAGATMAHSLVPPTPGPLYVVEAFSVNLILMMIVGTTVGLCASGAGYGLAVYLNRVVHVEIPDDDDVEEPEEPNSAQDPNSPPAPADPNGARAPGLLPSLLPIILPVLLIGAGTASSLYLDSTKADDSDEAAASSSTLESAAQVMQTLGDKNIALIIAAAVAVGLLVVSQRLSRTQLAEKIHHALSGAGVIILITAGGGAFGTAIRQCGIADVISELEGGIQPLLLLPIAFAITAMIRTAQGSATVAMVTAAGILQGFAKSEVLDFNVVYFALAVGCGSKPIAWMADSGFWVICKMSGMTESQGLKTITPMSIVMGLAGLFATMFLAVVLPWPERILG